MWWRRAGPEASARGAHAEDAALRLLAGAGLQLVARNFRCRGGELDLVMLDGRTLVVVEVRARGSAGFASAAESVDARKQARIVRATQLFVAAQPEHAQRAIRFDVVAFDGAGHPDWIRAAFDAG
ncbi:YraN family protein [Fontimonas sp. SYSU GA230001]|uniref:YraN family protein n=1 Tax=Fontimonas sp. SYSU GA230001 TaxID=3142450 RepID=UPI0032B45A27